MGNKSSIKKQSYYAVTTTLDGFGVPTGQPNRSIGQTTVSKVRTAGNDPLYQSKIALGKSATNPLSGIYDSLYISRGHGVALTTNGGGFIPGYSYYDGDFGLSGIIAQINASSFTRNTTVDANSKNAAAIGIRKKISQETQTYSGLEFLGELRETIHQIRHPAQAAMNFAHDYARDVKRRRGRNRRNLRKALAGSWLEFSFGLKPLINDVTNAALASIAVVDEYRLKRLSFSGHSEAATSRSNDPSDSFPRGIDGGNIVSFDRDVITAGHHYYTVGYNVKVPATTSRLDRMISFGGFDWANAIPAAWELLPLSVFVDYFTNIGDVLSTNLVSMENVAWVNSTSVQTQVYRWHSGRYSGGSRLLYLPDRTKVPFVEYYRKWVTRTADPVDFPQLRFELPMKGGQLANLSAFLTLILTK